MPKLIYFNARYRCEGIRYVLAAAGASYEDARLTQNKWPQIKETLPIPKCPAWIEDDGNVLQQSLAIATYLAHRYGLLGENAFERAKSIELAHSIEDQLQHLLPYVKAVINEKSDTEQNEALDTYIHTHFQRFAEYVESILQHNNDNILLGSKLTMADLFVAEFVDRLQQKRPAVVDNYPKLAALTKHIHSLPNIKTYIEARPNSVL